MHMLLINYSSALPWPWPWPWGATAVKMPSCLLCLTCHASSLDKPNPWLTTSTGNPTIDDNRPDKVLITALSFVLKLINSTPWSDEVRFTTAKPCGTVNRWPCRTSPLNTFWPLLFTTSTHACPPVTYINECAFKFQCGNTIAFCIHLHTPSDMFPNFTNNKSKCFFSKYPLEENSGGAEPKAAKDREVEAVESANATGVWVVNIGSWGVVKILLYPLCADSFLQAVVFLFKFFISSTLASLLLRLEKTKPLWDVNDVSSLVSKVLELLCGLRSDVEGLCQDLSVEACVQALLRVLWVTAG